MQVDINSHAQLVRATNYLECEADKRANEGSKYFYHLIHLDFKFTTHVKDFMLEPIDASNMSTLEKTCQVGFRILVGLLPLIVAALADITITILCFRDEEERQLIQYIAHVYALKYDNIENLEDNLKQSKIDHLFIKCYYLDAQEISKEILSMNPSNTKKTQYTATDKKVPYINLEQTMFTLSKKP